VDITAALHGEAAVQAWVEGDEVIARLVVGRS
jgi:hypothetical protein